MSRPLPNFAGAFLLIIFLQFPTLPTVLVISPSVPVPHSFSV